MISAIEIADALGRPRPTAGQQRVIEADLRPALVVAGAGSGKTETMAGRVLWLLANRLVTADQVLGLTFTRKAAGELSVRIRERIGELASIRDAAVGLRRVRSALRRDLQLVRQPHLPRQRDADRRESDGAVLGEAAAWQLARRVVVGSTDPRLPSLGRSADQLTKDVLGVSRALTENLADATDVVRFAAEFGRLLDLPSGGRGSYPDVDELVKRVALLPPLLDLAEEYEAEKLRRGLVEYSDQVALALRIVRQLPAVVADHRDRYRVVLLDEYQDTSVMQTWLLSDLFAEHPVMAVGDPNQSIYGWRGASSANLAGFSRQFAHGDAQRFSLVTSWRNGHQILAAANATVTPLADAASGAIGVDRLEAGPGASDLPVEMAFAQDIEAEAEAVATWLAPRLAAAGADGVPPSAAMLFRARRSQGVFIDALRRHGIPYHVLGVGGLMAEPEVADLVSALTVVHDPHAGSELVRLLAGSRWRVGVRDLMALRQLARWLASRDYAQRPLDDELRATLRDSVADGDAGSIVDALDFLAAAKPGHSALEGFSGHGLERLRDAGRTFARLRGRAGLDLPDFVTFVEQDLLLDVEVLANEERGSGRAPMEAFADALGSFLAVDDSGIARRIPRLAA